MTAFWKYYLDSTVYNIGFSFLVSIYAGLVWGFIVFGTVGTLIGLIIYAYFKENEYCFYHNLGYSKRGLIAKLFLINLMSMVFCLAIYALLSI